MAAVLLLLGAALALYWTSLRHPLIFDDYHLREQAFKAVYNEAAAHVSAGVLRWPSSVSFALVYGLFGADLLWQRLANVLLHAATGALLCGFLARLFGAVLADAASRRLAVFGALWFVLHPVAVYGVAYLAERSIILATLFVVLALWCTLEALLRRSPGWYVAAVAAYVLAIWSKEHAVMAPAVAAVLAVLVRGASFELARRLALVLAPFAAVGLVVILKSKALLGTAYEPFASDVLAALGAAQGDFDPALAYPLSVLNQATLFFRYLLTWLLPWPGWMSIDVRTPFPRHLLELPYCAGLLAWIAFPAGAAWLLAKRGRLGLAGFGLLAPWLLALTEISVVRIQEPFVLYRSYLWMFALPAIVPAAVGALSPRWQIGVLALACLALVPATRDRLESFSSPLRVWDDAVRKNTDPGVPYAERAYVARGIVHLDAARLEPARADIERALEINPRSPDALLARGTLHLRSARLDEALEDLSRAIALDPRYGSAYDKRCVVRMGLKRPAEAIADCETAVVIDPSNHEAWINYGVVSRALGRRAEAERSYQRALELAPKNASAHYNYGVLLLESGRRDEPVRRHIVIACDGGIAAACDILRRSR